MQLARLKKISPVLPLFIVGHFSHHVATGGLVPLLPWLRDAFQLDYTRSGLLLSAFSLTYGLAQLPIAGIADRWSKTRLVGLGLMGVAAGAFAFSFSPSYYFLIGLLVLIGIFGSTYHAPASSFLSQWFSQEQRGRALGLHMIGGSGSLLFTPAAAVLIATVTGDWRYSFIVLAIPAFFAGLLIFGMGRRYEKVSLAAMANKVREKVSFIEIIRIIGLLVAVAMISQLVTSGINSFLPLYLVDKHGVSNEIGGMMVGLISGAGVLGGPVGGTLSDRFGRRPVIMLTVILAGPLAYLITVAPFGAVMIVTLILYGMVSSARMPTIESLIADTVPWHRRATVMGAYYLLNQEAAGIVTPVVGSSIDSFGLNNAFTGMAVISLIFSALILLLRKRV